MNIITLAQMHVDDVDSGLPLLTLDASATGGPGPVTFALAPDAVRGLVDALIGVAPPSPGQARIVIKVDTSDLRAMLAQLHSDRTPTQSGLPPSECSLASILDLCEREKLARASS